MHVCLCVGSRATRFVLELTKALDYWCVISFNLDRSALKGAKKCLFIETKLIENTH